MDKFLIKLCSAIQTEGSLQKLDLYSSTSPLQIKDKGYEAIERMGFKKAIDDNISSLLKTLNKLEPRSAFEVEQYSIGLINFFITDKDVHFFKETEDYIYIHPEYNNPEYFKTAGLYLRDKYLKEYAKLIPKENN